MWYTILAFLNFVGVITNAFIIGLTSRTGKDYEIGTTVLSVHLRTYNLTAPYSQHVYEDGSLLNGQGYLIVKDVATLVKNNLWIIIIFEVSKK